MHHCSDKQLGECETESTPLFKQKDCFQEPVGVGFRVEIEGEIVSESKMVGPGHTRHSMLKF
jgi:hypothetical protein